MEFFKFKKDIPVMKYAPMFNVVSVLTFLFAVMAIFFKGLNFGIEFTGGTVMELNFKENVQINEIRKDLSELEISEAIVQTFGSSENILIRVPTDKNITGAELSEKVISKLRERYSSLELRRVDYVGSQVGKEMVENGALALLFVSIGIILYLAIRFEWKFGLAAVIANLHDVIIILGFFAFFQWEFSLPVLAAVLAVLGYSVNESVVVFDRIRENFKRMRKAGVYDVINNSITKTMSRTIITHGSTELMVISILIFGGDTLFYFALALTIGILFGIYSSIFVASPLIVWFGIKREDLIKEEEKKDEAVV